MIGIMIEIEISPAPYVQVSSSTDSDFRLRVNYTCKNCEIYTVSDGRRFVNKSHLEIQKKKNSGMLTINIRNFIDNNASVYVGIFVIGKKHLMKIVAVVENNEISVEQKLNIPAVEIGKTYTININLRIANDIAVKQISCNGKRITSAFAKLNKKKNKSILSFQIRNSTDKDLFGVFQATFEVGIAPDAYNVTKTIMYIGGYDITTANSSSDKTRDFVKSNQTLTTASTTIPDRNKASTTIPDGTKTLTTIPDRSTAHAGSTSTTQEITENSDITEEEDEVIKEEY